MNLTMLKTRRKLYLHNLLLTRASHPREHGESNELTEGNWLKAQSRTRVAEEPDPQETAEPQGDQQNNTARSYLDAEPEVQAEVALYQTTRAPKGTFVEYTSRISNKLREMESGFKEFLRDRPS